ncbi:MAG: hypothetical protein ACODAQ_03335 [Phycisphaeraceae bacterium]
MRSVKMPQRIIVAIVLGLFVAALFGIRQYGALGSAGYGVLALGAAAVCAMIVGGLIYANYESYSASGHPSNNGHVNGTCQ